ncbi:N-acyl-D-amino acid deacylase [Lysobacteraceae bacterium NML91-0213]|nr:N-acyl-D-amino acid deacylase [Xanthomonadaceae bacterium NML91-0213]
MPATRWSRRDLLAALGAAGTCAVLPSFARDGSTPMSSLLLRDVRVVDGTGAPARAADVLVQAGRIARIGRLDAGAARGLRVVEGGGRVLAPGFIDLHVHGDPREASYAGFLAMGVTTVVLGQDGSSPSGAGDGLAPWLAAVERARPDINVAALAGHGTLRRRAGIADDERVPDAAALQRLAALLQADLDAGAFGMSTGLEYVPGMYAGAAELGALGRLVASRDGVAMSHMRSEDDDRVEASLAEHIDASRPARTHVSHLKVVHGEGEARAARLLAALAAHRGAGVELTADAYPYSASYTGVGILFPDWALPPHDYAQVRAARGEELRAALEQRMRRRGGPQALLFGSGEHAGQTLAEVAARMELAFPDALLELGPGAGSAAHFVMDEALQARLMLDPHVAIASDGGPGMRHPRSTGTFARWIGDFAATGRVGLEEAVRKVTSMPASILRLPDRGVLREGAIADLVLFDPARVRARSDYLDPFAHAQGFDLVLIGGVPAFEAGEVVSRGGHVLRHRGRA